MPLPLRNQLTSAGHGNRSTLHPPKGLWIRVPGGRSALSGALAALRLPRRTGRSALAWHRASRTGKKRIPGDQDCWPGLGIHAAWPVLVRSSAGSLRSCSGCFTGSRRRERGPGSIQPDRLARWSGPVPSLTRRRNGSRPPPILAPCGHGVRHPAAPGARCCQRCAVQGPTPEIRSTLMWVMYPGGGLSIGGKRTSGPR